MICFLNTLAVEEPATAPFHEVRRLEAGLYVGKMSDRPLWLVMGKIDDSNHSLWFNYAQQQIYVKHRLRNRLLIGSGIFFRRLRERLNHETWVAYISNEPVETKIPSFMQHYRYDHVQYKSKDEASTDSLQDQAIRHAHTIEMFVTVNTQPTAIITTHMGIARSVEAVLSDSPHKGLSIDLHSFAAKVMLLENPERIYMITMPEFSMEVILLNKLPRAIFLGTR